MLSKALQEVGEDIISIIKSQGKDLTTKEEVEQVATISAQDPEIGKIIADIVDKVGND
jgi:chaperonin GroEL